MHAILYRRASKREQKLSLDAQRHECEAYARRAGLEIVAMFDDFGVSGSAPVESRPGLMRALGELSTHKGACLLVAKRDRLARSVLQAAIAEAMAESAGSKIVSADGVGEDTSPEGALMRNILDAFAEFERAKIKCRTIAALAVNKRRGRRIGSVPPFGWRHEGKRLVPNPDEQPARDRILELRAGGMSYGKICETLEEEGYPPRTNWSKTAVRRVVKYKPPGTAV